MPVLSKELFRLPESKYRRWAILCSLALVFTGVIFCLTLVSAFFNPGSLLSMPGSFLIRCYGLLAFIIPAWFLYAAFLLADPAYRPEQILILCGIIFPFFTLATGFYWIREFETIRGQSSLIAWAGKIGTGFFVFFIAALEILTIILLRVSLFSRKQADMALREEPEENLSPPLEFSRAKAPLEQERVTPLVEKDSVTPPLEDDNVASPSGQENIVAPPKQEKVMPELADAPKVSREPSELEPVTEDDEDVEKALAEASAFAATFASSCAETHSETAASSNIGEGSEGKTSAGFARAAPERLPKRNRGLPYSVPVEGILKKYPDGEYWIIDDDTRNAAHTLKETFKEFNIQVEVTGIRKGPVITMFEILPAPGIRLTKIEGLADNIALRLAAQSVRIVAPIPGKHAVGIEVPNAKRNIVSFREIIEGELNRDGKKIEVPIVLGKDITGEAVTVDLVQMPHLLIAGSTGSGKSVCVNSMILTILYQKPPAECRLILIDPKIVELKLYNDIPHLLTPVITEPKKAFQALQYCIYEMERRYSCLDSMGVRDIRSYNRRIKEREIAAEFMPYIVVVIDEFADLMATTGKELESTVARLAAMSRAVGIHLVLATQRPSIDVITGLIKANIPSRIAFMVASKMDSRIIIDMVGAEKLLGKGDMLYAGVVDPFPIRMQGAFISEEEVERVVDYVKSLGEPDYIDDEIFFEDEEDSSPSLFSEGEDPLYEKALEIVFQQGKASASYIQRRLKIGYNRAARLVEEMEQHGVVGPAQGSKPREVLRGAAIN